MRFKDHSTSIRGLGVHQSKERGSQVHGISPRQRARDTIYTIRRHDRLYLDVRGEGRAAWRIRYRPKPNAN